MLDPARLEAALAGRYTIERLVGEGGMATVYLARDIRHDRPVALKVLKPELGAILGAERFLAEIRVTANLQHPNLLPLFDSGEVEGVLFYVMPFVEGETLRGKLEREKQLPIDEAVRIAAAVGNALDYAHRHGVIHRDLKPENVLLHDGQPVVADFGIALAVSNAGGTRITQTGLSLGTPQYMSPEQASGDRAVDARSDIYSLAAMTFEMVAGEPPHSGTTAQAVIAKLMTVDPPSLTSLRRTTPVHVELAVERGLAKLPADRFASAREYVEALEGRGGLAFATQAAASTRSGGRRIGRWVPAALAVAFLATAGLAFTQWRSARAVPALPLVRFEVGMPSSMLVGNTAAGRNLAVSPDGRLLIFTAVSPDGASRAYLRPLAEPLAQPIPGTEGAQQATFSPDGGSIAFLVRDEVWRVRLTGGAPTRMGRVPTAPVGLAWARDDRVYVGSLLGLQAVSANGETEIVARADTAAGELYANNPLALPDGEHVLFSLQPNGGLAGSRLASWSLRTGTLTRTDLPVVQPLGLVEGALVYTLADGSLMAVGYDADAARPTSDPVALGPTVLTRVSGASEAVVSPAGTLAYIAAETDAQVGWVTLRGEFSPVLADPQVYGYPRLSPDGRRIALSIESSGRADVWSFDLASSTPTRLTNDGDRNDRVEWSHDGRRVLYRTDRTGRVALWWQPVDLSAPAEPLLADPGHDFYEGMISPDGRWLVYQVDDNTTEQADVRYRGLGADTTDRPLTASRFIEAQARVSPDGRWVAYVTDASGAPQVVVQPFPGGGGQVQVSVEGGQEPVWAPDGQRLFYRDSRSVMAADLDTRDGFVVTRRTALFRDEFATAQAPHANYDVSPDGTRLLMIKPVRQPEIHVTSGWLAELRAAMAR